MNPRVRNAPISVRITVAIVVVLIAAITLLAGFAYAESRTHLVEIEDFQRAAAESSLVGYHRLMDRDLAFFDDLYTGQVRAAFPAFLAEYERAGRDPAAMDLAGLKRGLGDGYDLYVIDARGVIVATTFAEELGFDLTTYPGIDETLTAMRMGDGFVSDRVVQEKGNGSYRKYAYHPTPDHRYLFEIGLKDSALAASRKQLYTPVSVDDLRQRTPSLQNVTVFNILKRPIRAPNGTVPRDPVALERAIGSRRTTESADPANATLSRYLFIDLLDPAYASDPSLAVEIVYSTRQLQDAISLLGLEYLLIALLAVVMGALFAFGLATLVARPVRGLVDDIERVAGGDLDHPLSGDGTAELGMLRGSIDRMTARLREQLAAATASEQRVREQNEALETRVAERTRELAEANEEAHLYIDLVTHDLSATLSTSLELARAMEDGTAGPPQDAAARLREILLQGDALVRRVAHVERLRHLDLPLEEVALDLAIREGIACHPDLSVRYDGTEARVMADIFLSEVFVNLLGEIRPSGGSGANCRVRVEEHDAEVVVSLEDDGPGIPVLDRERLFARPARGGTEPPLGLSIAGALVRRYGGRIWAEGGARSDYARGTVIRITFPRRVPGSTA